MKMRFLQVREPTGDSTHSPGDVANIMSVEAKIDRECFWVLHLNAQNRVIERELVSVGTATNSLIHPREVFRSAVMNGATGIITVHNHPGGRANPSRDDLSTWEKLDQAGAVLGIKALDHLIITPSGEYYSRSEHS